MIPIGQFLPDVLAQVLSRAPMTPEKVAFAWRQTVGAAVDRSTTVSLRDGVLYVQARDATWRREVKRSEALILRRMNTLLGDNAVTRIKIARLTGP
jgi:predicted nucleic acid-binding Zn ribbon protein